MSLNSLLPYKSQASFSLALFLIILTRPIGAQTVTIVGTPHLAQQQTLATAPQETHVVEQLIKFEPTRVCIEALSGERIAMLMQNPAQNAEVLNSYASVAVRLSATQQVQTAMGPYDAATAASELARKVEKNADRVKLISLQLAAYNPHSAALNWSYLSAEQRKDAEKVIGRIATDSLNRLLESKNEISVLAIPLARKRNLAELCAVDVLDDEVAVAKLADQLMPIVNRPEIAPRLAKLNDISSKQWQVNKGLTALTDALIWYNGSEFSVLDRTGQWDIFNHYDNANGVGGRRLMLWHARNSEITAALFREIARGGDERVMLIIGAAHRQFLEAQISSQPWLEYVPANTYLNAK